LYWIVAIASKGGNYLLNIGPMGDGTVPEESISLLHEAGDWMKINGEVIYGTLNGLSAWRAAHRWM
jgi:alpha-L-fucosidase